MEYTEKDIRVGSKWISNVGSDILVVKEVNNDSGLVFYDYTFGKDSGSFVKGDTKRWASSISEFINRAIPYSCKMFDLEKKIEKIKENCKSCPSCKSRIIINHYGKFKCHVCGYVAYYDKDGKEKRAR